MGATGIIFRREIGAYLRSPMGYIVVVVVLLLDGVLFYAVALGPNAGQLLSGEALKGFFYNASGMTAVAAVALSIRLIAEDRQTGTLLLLETSPVKDWEIVLGKFLSALAFLWGITLATAYVPLLLLVNGKIALGHILVGYLGMLFLGAAVLSIGLFATALTRHQLVAAAVASVITGSMFLFSTLARVVGAPLSFVLDALTLHDHRWTGFGSGVLNLSDAFYYAAVAYFFLYAATRVMELKRWE